MMGDELFAWQVQEPDRRWSMVGAMVGSGESGGVVHTPLVHRSRDLMESMRPLAQSHADGTGQPLRLARFCLAETLEAP